MTFVAEQILPHNNEFSIHTKQYRELVQIYVLHYGILR